MNYKAFVGISHVTAACCAGIAALGAAIGFHELSGSWIVSGLIGAGTAVVLGLGWFGVIGAAASTRRAANIGLIVIVGLFLTGVALAVSGWSLATALGGQAALRHHQQQQVANHDLALANAFKRVTAQQPLQDAVLTAGTVYRGYVDSEVAQGGCGPRCRTYQSMQNSLASVAETMKGQVDQAVMRRREAEAAIGQARLGHDVEENLALAAGTIAYLNTIDLDAKSVGLVQWTQGAEGVSSVATDDLTQAIVAADSITPDAVPVPVYEHTSKAEATLQYMGKVAGAWVAAAGIDCAPFLLLLLVIALWQEPLLRNADTKPRPTDDDIRTREDSILGTKPEPEAPAQPSEPAQPEESPARVAAKLNLREA